MGKKLTEALEAAKGWDRNRDLAQENEDRATNALWAALEGEPLDHPIRALLVERSMRLYDLHEAKAACTRGNTAAARAYETLFRTALLVEYAKMRYTRIVMGTRPLPKPALRKAFKAFDSAWRDRFEAQTMAIQAWEQVKKLR